MIVSIGQGLLYYLYHLFFTNTTGCISIHVNVHRYSTVVPSILKQELLYTRYTGIPGIPGYQYTGDTSTHSNLNSSLCVCVRVFKCCYSTLLSVSSIFYKYCWLHFNTCKSTLVPSIDQSFNIKIGTGDTLDTRTHSNLNSSFCVCFFLNVVG